MFAGSFFKKSVKASNPPAEAPMPTIVKKLSIGLSSSLRFRFFGKKQISLAAFWVQL
jgi:hypothetical protein